MYLAPKYTIMNRFTVSLEDELLKEIDEISEKNHHSRNTSITLLLQQAVKERQRKRRAKIHTGHNTADVHKNDSR